jgi:hypothetical protein
MTKSEAPKLIATDSEYEPETYEDAAEVFAALYERRPDDADGDQGDVWSLCCAYGADNG